VVSEACFLLGRYSHGTAAVVSLIERGIIDVSFHLDAEIAPIVKLLSKYASVPMSLADACIVRMSELHRRLPIVTLDSDFRIYRRNGRQALPVLLP
jgi:predicted nucleic acid-binding protein